MTNVICTTTINSVTPEIKMYDRMEGWELIVTGDAKSPEYELKNGTFISWEQQQADYPQLCKLIGPNSTMRGRMIALLEARKRNPELVAMVDDDCLPYPDWPGQLYIGRKGDYPFIPASLGFDVGRAAYGVPSRGFPPQLWFQEATDRYDRRDIVPLLQSNPCDGQADVDAVWRLGGKVDYGYSKITVPVWSNGFSLINPMHTIIAGSALRDYCGEIPFVGHVCDIWAGYLFQAAHPNSTIYGPANCYHSQDRKYEKVLRELESEIYSYRYGLEFLQGLREHGPENLENIKCLPPEAVEAIEIYRSYFK